MPRKKLVDAAGRTRNTKDGGVQKHVGVQKRRTEDGGVQKLRKKRRFLGRWKKEIKENQLTTKLKIRKLPFSRLVREIAQNYKTDLRFAKDAFAALQEETEKFVADEVFAEAVRWQVHAKRVTMKASDVRNAARLYIQKNGPPDLWEAPQGFPKRKVFYDYKDVKKEAPQEAPQEAPEVPTPKQPEAPPPKVVNTPIKKAPKLPESYRNIYSDLKKSTESAKKDEPQPV